jgi:hypothetical protein
MQKVDLGGTIFLLNDEDGRYRYKFFVDKHGWQVALRDDGYRIYSMYIGERPTNEPLGEREWDLLWEYKHCDAPGYSAIVELIMTGAIGDET